MYKFQVSIGGIYTCTINCHPEKLKELIQMWQELIDQKGVVSIDTITQIK